MKKLIPIFILFLISCRKEIFVDNQLVINNIVVKLDTGYRINYTELEISKKKDFGKSYWKNVAVPKDVLVSIFESPIGFLAQIACGDFNNDGYIDIFNAGISTPPFPKEYGLADFLVWNQSTKSYDNKNLFNDTTIKLFGGNKNQVISVYLNGDDYVDFVIFDNGNEYLDPNLQPNEPIRLVLSDGKGKYDLKEIVTNENEVAQNSNHKGGGDIGDLNNDGVPDLLICGGHIYIYWGIKGFPYFTQTNRAAFANDSYNPVFLYQTNGFGEHTYFINGVDKGTIGDVNGDGMNDILLGNYEDVNVKPIPSQQKILINLGGGKFNDNGIINLPISTNNVYGDDFIIDNLNEDTLKDIISLNHGRNGLWNIVVYIQQKNNTFLIDPTYVNYKDVVRNDGGKVSLFYYDINKDGKKDIGYHDGAENGQLKNKTIFIREGNKFVEKDYYQYDFYCKWKLGK